MAMLISKFHRLIQSKLVWAGILIIIVFSFVIWGTQMPSKADRDNASSPGTLHGEAVDAKLFRQAYFNTYLTVIMSVGRQVNITPEIDQQLRKATWQRLVALQEARALGLNADDSEVASAIQQHEGFAQEGQFDKRVYKAFVQQFLAGLGFSERMFEEHVREEIIMQKARMVLDRATLISPLELKRAFGSVSDKFKVEYVFIKPALVTNEIKVGRDEARVFFEKDPAAFTLPEMVTVQYVRFDDAPFLTNVTVTEEEALAYYNENIADYEVEETNDLAQAATNLLANVGKRTLPFDEVKEKISSQLVQQAAREKNTDHAMNFVVALTPDRDGKAMTFEEVAKKFDATIEKMGPFSAQTVLKDLDADQSFNRAAFELTEGPETHFSNPVDGEKGLYVMSLVSREAERIPTFEEVETEVLPKARDQALVESLSRKAAEIRDTVDKALQSGQTFTEALVAFGLEPEPVAEFSSSSGLKDVENGELLMRAVMMNNEGELSDLVPAEDSVLLAHVVSRSSGDPATYGSIKDQLVATIRRQYGRMTFDAWQEDLLKQANFEDRQARSIEEEEPATEEEAADDAS